MDRVVNGNGHQTAEDREACRDRILSNNYYDFIFSVGETIRNELNDENRRCIEQASNRFWIGHIPQYRDINDMIAISTYDAIPKLFGLMDSSNMEKIGVTRLQNQPYLNLTGRGTLIGIIDTGIDYRHPAFRYSNGESRILRIWDQTIQTGVMPNAANYGSEYTQEMINEALASENPLEIVPSVDEIGHGTFMAGIAAGSASIENDFIGAAPDAAIAVVKLKQAKQYLRDYYFIEPNAAAYQENDIMLAVKFLVMLSLETKLPLVILMGLGSNMGGHSGSTYLDIYLGEVASQIGMAVITAAGNEGNRNSHYEGRLVDGQQYDTIEIVVAEGKRGFTAELWTQLPETLSISIVSPTGEIVPRHVARIGRNEVFDFLFENTKIYIDYQMPGGYVGNFLAFLRFQDPTPGIWQIRVYGANITTGEFHMWLPIHEFIGDGTYVVRSSPYITITEPSTAYQPITVSTYNHRDDSIYLNSGRGYTRGNFIKPDLAAPGVNIYGPIPNGEYGIKSGSSIAAAHTAGAVAILLSWGIVERHDLTMDTGSIKGYLVRGAVRKDGIIYPNREWGYGSLNIYNTFEALRNTNR